MAAKTKKKPIKRGVAAKSRRTSRSQTRVRQTGPGKFRRYFLPGVISACIIACLVALTVLGYRTVAASEFFSLKKVEVDGVVRSSRADIERIIQGQTERSGTWNADLPGLRQKVEKLPFVKFAAISRVLPSGIRVVVTERVPLAVIRLASGEFLVDGDGEVLAPADKNDTSLPMAIRGWDEAKTEKALKDNLARVKMFQRMTADWGEFGLVKRVKEVDLSEVLEPKAIVEDSGKRIPITLAKDNFAKSLKAALEALAGKGEKIKSVDSGGVYPVIEYMGN